MSNLTSGERQKLERLFNMGGGYVLNFSNRSFREFFEEHARIDIDQVHYSERGSSKANRLRRFWAVEPDETVGAAISALIEYGIEEKCLEGDAVLLESGRRIASRLAPRGSAPAPDAAITGEGTMLDWYLVINGLLRAMRQKAADAKARLAAGDPDGAKAINGYLKTDYQSLRQHWMDRGFDPEELGGTGRHIRFGDPHDYDDILNHDLPGIEAQAERHARAASTTTPQIGFEALLHPAIEQHSLPHYMNGHLREAVLNAVVAIFDLIRSRTRLDLDGGALATQAFSLDNPHLILSDLDSESGRNDQKGFMQIFAGAYLGIRNPKAHSLSHDLDEVKAAQYLVFASLLARRISEARLVRKP